MGEIELSFVKPDTKLEEAIEILRSSRVSGLVVDKPSGPALLDGTDILTALRTKGNVELSGVPARARTIRLPGAAPMAGGTEVKTILESQAAQYAIDGMVEGR